MPRFVRAAWRARLRYPARGPISAAARAPRSPSPRPPVRAGRPDRRPRPRPRPVVPRPPVRAGPPGRRPRRKSATPPPPAPRRRSGPGRRTGYGEGYHLVCSIVSYIRKWRGAARTFSGGRNRMHDRNWVPAARSGLVRFLCKRSFFEIEDLFRNPFSRSKIFFEIEDFFFSGSRIFGIEEFFGVVVSKKPLFGTTLPTPPPFRVPADIPVRGETVFARRLAIMFSL